MTFCDKCAWWSVWFIFRLFLNLHARIFASRAYNFEGLHLPVPLSLCLFGEHIYKSMAVMEFVIFWSLVGQLVSTIPVLFQYTLTFTITRVSQTSQMLLILICRQRLRSTGLLVRFLIFNIQLQINK